MTIRITAFLFAGVWHFYASIPDEGFFEFSGEGAFERILSLVESVKSRIALEAFWETVERYFVQGQQLQFELDEQNNAAKIRAGVANTELRAYESFEEAINAFQSRATRLR
jgi:hypothetical protein